MKIRKSAPTGGFTLVELMVGLAILAIAGSLAYTILISATTLLAKNLSINTSNTTVRDALDRVYAEISQANGLPVLLNADGSTASNASGPAAGIRFDHYKGAPYIVTNPSGSGLSATATSFQMKSSTNSLASPPTPVNNDVVKIGDSTARPLVASSSATISGGLQTITVQLQGPIGQAIPWTTSIQETAYVIHREAFIIVPVSGRAELRFYPNAETLASSNYNNASTYAVLTREIGTATGDTTPFSLVTNGITKFLNIAMRVEDHGFNNYLSTRQAKEFNTFLRVDTMVRPRSFL